MCGDRTALYKYVERLKVEVLPADPSRIFILRKSVVRGHEYLRLRTQYHLLPHNVYNFGAKPKRKAVREGDFILALGENDELRYSESEQRLYYGLNKFINVALVDQDSLATLYVVSTAGKGDQ